MLSGIYCNLNFRNEEWRLTGVQRLTQGDTVAEPEVISGPSQIPLPGGYVDSLLLKLFCFFSLCIFRDLVIIYLRTIFSTPKN